MTNYKDFSVYSFSVFSIKTNIKIKQIGTAVLETAYKLHSPFIIEEDVLKILLNLK